MDRGNHQPTALQVLLYKSPNEMLPLPIQIGRRLIQQPDRDRHQDQTRQSDAPLLSRRQSANRSVAPAIHPHAPQRIFNFSACHLPAQPNPVVDVLSRSGIGLSGRFVTDVSKIAVKSLQILTDAPSTPQHSPLFRVHQAAERPQQAALTGAVSASDLQALPKAE
jgi:hypothetical protein